MLVIGFGASILALNVGSVSAATVYNGRIAYTTNDSPGKIARVNPDPDNLLGDVIVEDDNIPYYGVSYSPDGTKLLYIIGYAPTDLMIAKYDGTGAVTAGESRFFNEASWHPSGAKLVVGAREGGSIFNVATLKTDGSNFAYLTSYAYTIQHPSYSPDGSKIIFSSTNDDDIYTMNADGTGVTNLTNGNGPINTFPSYSPDGTKIIYNKYDGSGNDNGIGIMNADGTGKTTISSAIIIGNPIYSPDGTKISYVDSSNHLHVMNADSTNDGIYASNASNYLTWQPLSLGPTSSTPNPTVSLSGSTATVNIPSMYADPYGEGIDASSISVTNAPKNGTATVDPTTGVITYTSTSSAMGGDSLLSRVGSVFFPKVSAATTDSFTYRVCSNTNSGLCSSGTVSIVPGAPNTGLESRTGLSAPISALSLLGVASVGYMLRKKFHKNTRN